MSYVPDELKYTSSHEWVQKTEEGTYRVGITDHAQEQLGDIVFVELPETDTVVAEGDEVGVVESVKTASDIYAPISGTITAVNEALEDKPELINESPYDDGWLFEIATEYADEFDNLLSADEYRALISEE
jgi:glycine cleavage system H protein